MCVFAFLCSQIELNASMSLCLSNWKIIIEWQKREYRGWKNCRKFIFYGDKRDTMNERKEMKRKEGICARGKNEPRNKREQARERDGDREREQQFKMCGTWKARKYRNKSLQHVVCDFGNFNIECFVQCLMSIYYTLNWNNGHENRNHR